ncbi:hypothetical protein LTR62_007405 [Meristemomyces frigidus]|uniref:Uncharacterized protein n=1 Tax=Meristemomyces frigidus TaxID=1508187 RepID=A0AAN7TH48_9PEZI|nr:hypothetical protein LTR62_007405 [Meristemomyces frigidus]
MAVMEYRRPKDIAFRTAFLSTIPANSPDARVVGRSILFAVGEINLFSRQRVAYPKGHNPKRGRSWRLTPEQYDQYSYLRKTLHQDWSRAKKKKVVSPAEAHADAEALLLDPAEWIQHAGARPVVVVAAPPAVIPRQSQPAPLPPAMSQQPVVQQLPAQQPAAVEEPVFAGDLPTPPSTIFPSVSPRAPYEGVNSNDTFGNGLGHGLDFGDRTLSSGLGWEDPELVEFASSGRRVVGRGREGRETSGRERAERERESAEGTACLV